MKRSIIKQIAYLDHCIKKYIGRQNDLRNVFNLTQFQIILYLLKHEGEDVCQKDLEKETHLKKASITNCIDTLAERGYVYRETAECDRRMNYIRLSDKTKAYADELAESSKELDGKIAENISKEDLNTFFRVGDIIINNIREAEHETDI